MKTIKWTLKTGFTECTHEGEIEVDDNATDEEIEGEVRDEALGLIDLWWEKK